MDKENDTDKEHRNEEIIRAALEVGTKTKKEKNYNINKMTVKKLETVLADYNDVANSLETENAMNEGSIVSEISGEEEMPREDYSQEEEEINVNEDLMEKENIDRHI